MSISKPNYEMTPHNFLSWSLKVNWKWYVHCAFLRKYRWMSNRNSRFLNAQNSILVYFQAYIRGHSITTWTRWGGLKMSVFVHAQGIKTVHVGGGVKKWQNSVHVVVEWPLRSMGLLSRNVALQNQPTLENRVYKHLLK